MFNGSYFCYRTISVSLSLLLGLILTTTAYAQTSAFTYQGRLTDSANPADGIFDMQFKLFDTATVGTGIQQGATITKGTVQVTNGVFDVELDFGAGVFTGAGRFLEISLRPAGSPDPRTILSPRQPVTSAPYAVRSATAGAADTATNATNASQLGGIAASGFIQNSASQQASTHFNISGNGTVGGLLSANAVNATAQYNLNGSRVLIAGGTGNLFVGLNAGAANTTGANNSFFGRDAGQANQTGSANAFFGAAAGIFNTASNNAFFGALAGDSNTSGTGNSFFGTSAGGGNQTGTNNSFFGFGAGFVNNANDNSFFGTFAGDSNTSGTNNSFFGRSAGQANQTGSGNSFFGFNAGFANTASDNSFFGSRAGESNTNGTSNAFFGRDAGQANQTGNFNAFFGHEAGSNNNGSRNSFFGSGAGLSNVNGGGNSFFGNEAGTVNTASDNSFFGAGAGDSNTTGTRNAFFGRLAGQANESATHNSFFGFNAGFANEADGNSFFGAFAGASNTSGTNNTFFGRNAGVSNTTSSNVTLIGANADVGTINPIISFATAIGAGAVVNTPNTVLLGRGVDTVRIPGKLRLEQLAAASNNHLCINFDEISTCSSSLRYKEHLAPFTSGLELINRLRPITFDWKHSGERDLGLAAEEVAAVEPLLVTYNKQGQIEGVKYDVITVVLVNAVRQQQQQITEKDEQIGNLRRQNSALDARLTVIEKKLSANKAARRQIARSAKRK